MSIESDLQTLAAFISNPCDDTQDDAHRALKRIAAGVRAIQTDEKFLNRLTHALRTVDRRLLRISIDHRNRFPKGVQQQEGKQ